MGRNLQEYLMKDFKNIFRDSIRIGAKEISHMNVLFRELKNFVIKKSPQNLLKIREVFVEFSWKILALMSAERVST